jgi:DNA-binding transcriptional regulator YiaG
MTSSNSEHRKAHFDLSWGRQRRQPLSGDNYVLSILDQLDKLERKTRPDLGAKSAAGKDLAAFEALEIAGKLVQYVAGWAMAHEIGLAAEGLCFVPAQPSGTKSHPDYVARKALVDDHRHEIRGAWAELNFSNPYAARKCTINILAPNCAGMPQPLQREIVTALEALDTGEVRPILEPVLKGNKRKLTESRLQIRAIAMVSYRETLGLKKHEAQNEVATALGVGLATLRSWEPRLKKKFGAVEVERQKSFAANHASYVRAEREREARGEEADRRKLDAHQYGYGSSALAQLAKEYKKALRFAGA